MVGVLAATAFAAGCAHSPTGPSLGGPTISCPAPITLHSRDGSALTVSYDPPIVVGESPVTTTCTPPSGAAFVVGTTSITCTATDSKQRAASCSFSVTVTAPPRLNATRFLAFGDSITAGVIPTSCPLGAPPRLTGWAAIADAVALRADINASPGLSYPDVLSTLLRERYTGQQFTVFNEGLPGETAADDVTGEAVRGGESRIVGAVAATAPEVVLLQEGVNDINALQTAALPRLIVALQRMIQTARGRGATVLLATLLPERAGGCRAFDFADDRDDISAANAQIRRLAEREGAILVDLHPVFAPGLSTLLSFDGLHPNQAGYRTMAETFFDVIRQRLEAPRR